MSGKTKLFVLHMKEIIYTGIFIFFGIIFLILLAMMFLPGKTSDRINISTEEATETSVEETSSVSQYTPGIYTASLQIGGNSLEMEIVVDQTGITDISFTHLDESIETMYPLFTPVLEDIVTQLQNGCSLDQITYEDAYKHTATMLIQTIQTILETKE